MGSFILHSSLRKFSSHLPKFSSIISCPPLFTMLNLFPFWNRLLKKTFRELRKQDTLEMRTVLLLHSKKWEKVSVKSWTLKLKCKQRMLSDLFLEGSHERMSWYIDQTFIHLYFQDVAINTMWHSTVNYTIIWHFVQITSPLHSSSTLASGYLMEKRCIKVLFL